MANHNLSYSMIFDRKKCSYPKYRHQMIKNPVCRYRESWVDDSLVHQCQKCDITFSFFVRKHHCRNCGRIFCSSCSNYFTVIEEKEITKPILHSNSSSILQFYSFMTPSVRVCKSCYISLNEYAQAEKLFHILNLSGINLRDIIEIGKVNKVWHRVSLLYRETFRKIQYRMPNHEYINDCILLLNNSHLIYGHSKLLVQFLCNKQIDAFFKENMISHITNRNSKYKYHSCWSLMCTRDCKKNMTHADAIICLQNCFFQSSVKVTDFLLNILKTCKIFELICYIPLLIDIYYKSTIEIQNKITSFVILRGRTSLLICSEIFWKCILTVSVNNDSPYKSFALKLRNTLLSKIPKEFHTSLKSAYYFVNELRKLSKSITDQTQIAEIEHEIDTIIQTQNSIHYPLYPNKQISAIIREKIHIKRSLCNPIYIPIECIDTETSDEYSPAFLLKRDDLRVDKIIIQCITVMDIILKDNGMNLFITDYYVLPVSKQLGLIDIIPDATTIYDIVHKNKFSIQNFIIENNQYATIDEIRQQYMKSCVGYCIIGYVLGIGDRHLENIMISKRGTIFHIDFGYVLGNEPKFFSPEIRITPEMIDAMGGQQSRYYLDFQKLCQKAYSCIRRHAPILYVILQQLTEISDLSDEYIYKQIMSRCMVGEQHDTAELHFITKVVKSSSNTYKHNFIDYSHDTSITAKALFTVTSMSNSLIKFMKTK